MPARLATAFLLIATRGRTLIARLEFPTPMLSLSPLDTPSVKRTCIRNLPLMLITFKSFKTQHQITMMYEKKLQLGSFHDAYFFFSFSFSSPSL